MLQQRELLEETSISVNITEENLVKIHPLRQEIQSGGEHCYMVILNDIDIKPLANTDAISADWYDIKSLEKEKLAFDHYDIIKYALK